MLFGGLAFSSLFAFFYIGTSFLTNYGSAAMELPRFGGFGDDVKEAVAASVGTRLAEVYSIAGKQEREVATDELHQSVLAELPDASSVSITSPEHLAKELFKCR